MPVYNGERYLRETIESVLDQTFSDFEFLIINDGSTDRTTEIVNSFHDSRIKHLSHKTNKGYVHALNLGLRKAQGEFIARQDADDISLPNRLEEQVGILSQHSDIVFVGSACHVIDETGTHIGLYQPSTDDTEIRWEMLFQNNFVHTSVMLRADAVHRNGLSYEPELVPAEDYNLWSDLLCYGHGVNIRYPLVKYRVHSSQVSRLAGETQRRMAERISRANVKGLGLSVSDATISDLRELHNSFPQQLSRRDMELCRVLLEIVNAFEEQAYVDRHVVRELRRRWVDRILTSIPANQQWDLWTSGLGGSLLGVDASCVFAHVRKRAIKRLGRILRGGERVSPA